VTTVLPDVRGLDDAGVAGPLRDWLSGHRRSDPAADAGNGEPTHPIGDPDEDDGPGYDDDDDDDDDDDEDDDEEPLQV